MRDRTIRIGWHEWLWLLAPNIASVGALAVTLAGYRLAGVVMAAIAAAWALGRLDQIRSHLRRAAGEMPRHGR
jgi:uncharacterized membrane-anchored protein